MAAVLEQTEIKLMRLQARIREYLEIIDDRERPFHERQKLASEKVPLLRELSRE